MSAVLERRAVEASAQPPNIISRDDLRHAIRLMMEGDRTGRYDPTLLSTITDDVPSYTIIGGRIEDVLSNCKGCGAPPKIDLFQQLATLPYNNTLDTVMVKSARYDNKIVRFLASLKIDLTGTMHRAFMQINH